MPPLFILTIAYPLLELWVLIRVGGMIGAASVLALILLSGVLGLAVMRQAGWQTLSRMRTSQQPESEMTDGMVLGIAGLLLFLPGLISDTVGLLMLLPSARRGIVRRLLGSIVMRRRTAGGAAASRTPDVIEGEFRRED